MKRLLVKHCSMFRYFSTNKSISDLSVPLFIPEKIKKNLFSKDTKVTKLQNGLTVASHNQYSFNTTVGVFIKCGPRYEVNHKSGVSHFLEKLAFQSTYAHKNKNDIEVILDKCGALSDCQLTRDILIYGLCGNTNALKDMVDLLSEAICRPLLSFEEIEEARQIIHHESHMMRLVPPPDNLLQDLIHQAAYSRNTLGLPRYTPEENINSITRKDIINFQAISFRPENMVLVGVGCEHEELLEYAAKYFVSKANFLLQDPDVDENQRNEKLDFSVPQITGGTKKIEQDLARYHTPMPEFAYVSVSLESVGFTSSQFVPAHVLQMLMGGGASFSSGGPGKGMYSRLYTEVLNKYAFVNSAQAVNHSYQDSGLFTLTGSCIPNDLTKLVEVLIKEFLNMGNLTDDQELTRAKNLTKSFLLTNLEIRNVVFEDIGRQVIYQGNRHNVDQMIESIEKVKKQDISDLVDRMLTTHPAIAGFGQLANLPSLESTIKMITSNQRFIPKIFNKFM